MTTTEIPHGTVTGYSHHKCRCDACRSAQTEAMRKYRAKDPAKAKAHNLKNQERNRMAWRWLKEHRPDIAEEIRKEVG
jgi:hypothetical protein